MEKYDVEKYMNDSRLSLFKAWAVDHQLKALRAGATIKTKIEAAGRACSECVHFDKSQCLLHGIKITSKNKRICMICDNYRKSKLRSAKSKTPHLGLRKLDLE